MIEAIYANIRNYYQRTFWEYSEAVTQYHAGYVLSYTGKSWLSGANQLWVDDENAITAAVFHQATEFFRPYRAEWCIFVMPERFPNLKQHCLAQGGYSRWSNPIMLIHKEPLTPHTNDDITIQRVQGAAMRQLGNSVIGEAFNMEGNVQERMIRPEDEFSTDIHHYLGYYQGHAAAAATMTYHANLAGIWNVGTRRLFRRKGLAHALMQHMAKDACHDGYPQTMLLASAQGRPIYAKMGYQVVSRAYYIALPTL